MTDDDADGDWATVAARSAFRHHALDDYDDIIAATAAAIRAERERCAVIVETEGPCRHVDHVQGFCACADKAALIRATPDLSLARIVEGKN